MYEKHNCALICQDMYFMMCDGACIKFILQKTLENVVILV